jgi:hypothetical protein
LETLKIQMNGEATTASTTQSDLLLLKKVNELGIEGKVLNKIGFYQGGTDEQPQRVAELTLVTDHAGGKNGLLKLCAHAMTALVKTCEEYGCQKVAVRQLVTNQNLVLYVYCDQHKPTDVLQGHLVETYVPGDMVQDLLDKVQPYLKELGDVDFV